VERETALKRKQVELLSSGATGALLNSDSLSDASQNKNSLNSADQFDNVGDKVETQQPVQAMAEQSTDRGFGLIGDTSQSTARLIANAIVHQRQREAGMTDE
jgi:lipopolysaccharide export system protein LptC